MSNIKSTKSDDYEIRDSDRLAIVNEKGAVTRSVNQNQLKKFVGINNALKPVMHEQKDVLLNSAGGAGFIVYGIRVDKTRELAYISQSTRGLAIVDISDVSNLTQLGGFTQRTTSPIWHPIRQVGIAGDRVAFVTRNSNEGTIELLDVSDPANPVSLDFQSEVADFSDVIYDINTDSFVIAGQVEGVYRYSNTVPMVQVASNETGNWETQGVEIGVIDGINYTFFSNYRYGIRIVDTETLGLNHDVVIADETVGFAGGKEIRPFKGKLAQFNERSYLFCTGNTTGDTIDGLGMTVLDVTDPSNPFWLPPTEAVGANYDWTAGDLGDKPALCIDIYNNMYAVIGTGHTGAAFFDIRVPERCRFLGIIDNMDTYTGSGGTEKDSCVQVAFYEKDGELYLISGDGAHTPNTEGSDQIYMDKLFT